MTSNSDLSDTLFDEPNDDERVRLHTNDEIDSSSDMTRMHTLEIDDSTRADDEIVLDSGEFTSVIHHPTHNQTNIAPPPEPPNDDKIFECTTRNCLAAAVCLATCLLIFVLVAAFMPGKSNSDSAPLVPETLSTCLFNATTTSFVNGTPNPKEKMPENLTIAYVGDVTISSEGPDTAKLYALIKAEGADALVISGDLDYVSCPKKFDDLITEQLGSTFPVFTSLGNHDLDVYKDYSYIIAKRWERAGINSCVGEAGKQHVCTFKGLTIAQVAPGIFDDDNVTVAAVMNAEYAEYLNVTLAQYRSKWMTCSWHKNQAKMQTGGKANDTGFGVYEVCREYGALIATGHEHSYNSLLYIVTHDTFTLISPHLAACIEWIQIIVILYPLAAGCLESRHSLRLRGNIRE